MLYFRCVYSNPQAILVSNKTGSSLTESTVQMLLEIAHYFQVADIVNLCEQLLCGFITIFNACELLDIALLYELDQLREKAIDFIDDHAKYIINSETFLDTSEHVLRYVLKGDTFFADNASIEDKVTQWMDRNCETFEKTSHTQSRKHLVPCNVQNCLQDERALDMGLPRRRVKRCEKLTLNTKSLTTTKTTEKSCNYSISVKRDVVLKSVKFAHFKLFLDWGCAISPFLASGLPVRVTLTCEKIDYSFTDTTTVGTLNDLKLPTMRFPKCSSDYNIKVSIDFFTSNVPLLLDIPIHDHTVSVESKCKEVIVSCHGNDTFRSESPDSYIDQPIYWIGAGVSRDFDETTRAPPALIHAFKFTKPSGR